MARGLVVSLGVAALLTACGDDEETHARPERPTATHETPSPEGDPGVTPELASNPASSASRPESPRLGTARERCEIGPARVIAPTDPPGRTLEAQVAVAADREARSALVAIDGTAAHDAVELWWPDAESETASHGAWLRDLEPASLFALERTGPDTALLVRTSPCVEQGHAAQCLFARALHTDGASAEVIASDPVRVAMAGPPTTMRVASAEGRVLVARSHHASQPRLDTFHLDAQTHGVRHVGRALGEGLDLERGPVEILALTTTGGSYAVLFRQGAQEASDSSVTLSTGLDEHAVPELREALVIDSMAIVTGAIVMIAAFEFSEPSWLRMGMDGEMLGEPRPLPAGEDVPLPFTDRRVARVDGTPPRTIEIRDGAGHATAPVITLPSDVRTADLARFDGGFLLTTLSEDGNVRVATLRCRVAGREQAPPGGDDNARLAR